MVVPKNGLRSWFFHIYHEPINSVCQVQRNATASYPMKADKLLKRITLSPEICHGKPCIRGLRYPVEFILEMLSGDTTEAELLEDYPDLERADIKAAQTYAVRVTKLKSFAPLPAA